MALSTKKKVLLARIQPTPGFPMTPSGGNDAILSVGLKLPKMQSQSITRNTDRVNFGSQKKDIFNVYNDVEFGVELAGFLSGSPLLGYGPLIRACGYAEKRFASPHSSSPQAGSLNSLTLSNSASATDDVYQYLYIFITSGTGAGQYGIIKTYDGTSKIATLFENWFTPVGVAFPVATDATSAYSIPRQISYAPVSSSFEMITIWDILDGQRHPLSDVRGNMSLSFKRDEYPLLNFKFSGIYVTPTSEVDPVSDWSRFIEPEIVSNSSFLRLFNENYNFLDVTMDTGAEINYRNLGAESIDLSDRQTTGSVEFEAVALSEQNFYTLAANGTYGSCLVQHGSGIRKTIMAYQPNVQLESPDEGDFQKTLTMKMGMSAQPTDLFDDEMILIIR